MFLMAKNRKKKCQWVRDQEGAGREDAPEAGLGDYSIYMVINLLQSAETVRDSVSMHDCSPGSSFSMS